jgi:hypothetical protein
MNILLLYIKNRKKKKAREKKIEKKAIGLVPTLKETNFMNASIVIYIYTYIRYNNYMRLFIVYAFSL